MLKKINKPETWLVAHRGDQDGGIENTLAAFESAIKSGAQYAECDIQFTRDMVPVVIHDDSLKRLCDLALHVSLLDLIDLKELCHPYFTLLTLSKLLTWLERNPQLTLFIEIKPDIRTRIGDNEIAAILSKQIPEALLSHIVLISESGHILDACRPQPNCRIGWVAEKNTPPESDMDYVFISYKKAETIAHWHDKGIKVGLYTINETKLAHEMLAMGADLIETDRYANMLIEQKKSIEQTASTDTDILIIGGGIYGCGVAQATSACGYRTMLIEQKKIASGTSSQSTKLIHGGLRYLEQMNLKLVYEGLNEREHLLRLAPSLVTREWFYIPVYQDSKRPPWMIACGLLLYFILSGGRSKFKWLSKSEWTTTLPRLNTQGLRAILAYEDASTDDAALTRAVATSAQSFGCDIHEKTTVEHAIHDDSQWLVRLSDGQKITTKILVNAGGPWVNQITEVIKPTPPSIDIQQVQGSHLVLNRPCPGFIYTESLDGRVMFFRPWKGKTLAGTTETPFPYHPNTQDDPSKAAPTESEIADILATYNHYFPDFHCRPSDIDHTFCGLRVLPITKGTAFGASRETVILCDDKKRPRYLAIYGGKLTTYRKESEKVLNIIMRHITPPKVHSTQDISLP